MREVQTLAFAVRRSADWRDARDVLFLNILPQISFKEEFIVTELFHRINATL